MPIKWLKKALRNVEQAHDYIARDHPAAAVRVVLKIQAAVAQLENSPHIGRLGRVEGTRELVVLQTPYIVIYRVTSTTVTIIRVLHSSRKYPS
ncbi:type II toxin-antitoxin system RelE/ParE family toxin [Iningainema tapete]|uniref:Type II toxin-antitoxin system RelE/ParE family toxin n=1 Tax=Iningainema tapete BLCC-T55 TaxID=2748662 RepID=A0A8J6XGE7_9CYAN|nr:type II toxin-antitoxin system RelE/ParE family toxin [Iningainema tapete]MBD2773753.1 type II toxin-antitoxin system RelE/ParE family toxin [Iningainema tapete BLCC-T55]